jgi:hypothetical protein
MAGFKSNLADQPEIIYTDSRLGMSGRDPLSVQIALSGHKDLGIAFQALDGIIRGAASLGARNAARSILRISKLQVPYDKGDLHDSGRIQTGEMQEAVDMGAVQRKIGGFSGGIDATGFDPFLSGDDDSGAASAPETFRRAINQFDVVYDDDKAWYVHEVEQGYHQAGEPTSSSKGAATVPDSEGRRRGTKYLERALAEIEPKYPDWVAAEIEAMLGKMKPPPAPPKPDMRPRLVKRSK